MPAPVTPPLSLEQVKTLSKALEAWLANHPDADAPAIGFGESIGDLTPRQITKVVAAHAFGETSVQSHTVLRMFRYVLDEVPFPELVMRFHVLASIKDDGESTRL